MDTLLFHHDYLLIKLLSIFKTYFLKLVFSDYNDNISVGKGL